MDTKVIPLSALQANLEDVLHQCLDTRQPLVVEIPDRGFVTIQALHTSDDNLVADLIEHHPAFRELLAKSLASPRQPFEVSKP